MKDLLINMVITFFVGVGLLALIQHIYVFFLNTGRKKVSGISISVTVDSGSPNIEYIIKSLAYQTSSIKTQKGAPEIIIIDNGMDDSTKNICQKLQKDYETIILARK